MRTSERQLHDRLGSALFRLAALKERAQSSPARSATRLLSDIQRLAGELEHTLTDLQHSVARQAELQQQAAVASRRSELLFELLPVPCILLDSDGTVVDANPPAVEMLNVSHRHLTGKPFQLFLGGERDLFLARLQSLPAGAGGERWPAVIRPRERSAVRATLIAAPDPAGRVMVLLVADGGRAGAADVPAGATARLE